jgi:MerR family transcriptional regulator, light-induced transcriptional regulator
MAEGLQGFSIRDVVERSGVAEGTLRMWEHRHGFPVPERLPSGHRRYSARDIELIRRVAAERAAGMSVAAAIERASKYAESPPPSVYAMLRRRRRDLEPRRLSKPLMLAMSRALEDESLSRAERPILFASFQRERFYRASEARWRELARGADTAIVFADFKDLREPAGGPAEVPVAREHPLMREWAIVCDAEGHAACLAGWEPPPDPGDPGGRWFESIWSVEPEVVREAARVCVAIAAVARPELVERLGDQLSAQAAPPAREQLRLAAAITNRTLSYLPQNGR